MKFSLCRFVPDRFAVLKKFDSTLTGGTGCGVQVFIEWLEFELLGGFDGKA